MKIISLGTGTSQGVPVIGCLCPTCNSDDPRDKRLRSSIYIETERLKLLIDIGPDFRQQFLSNDLSDVDAVLITHEHNDHVVGLDDIRAINFAHNKSIPVYASERVAACLRRFYPYIFNDNPYPGVPRVELHIINEEPFYIKNLLIRPIQILHGRLNIFGFRIKDMAYLTDAKTILEHQYPLLNNLKVLIINALRKKQHHSHFTLKEALAEILKIKPEQAYLTHISHLMGLTAEWAQDLPSNVMALQDKQVISIDVE